MSVIDTLRRSERRDDREEESIRILLAATWSVSPQPALADFVERAYTIAPQLRLADPTLVAAVARSMNLGFGA